MLNIYISMQGFAMAVRISAGTNKCIPSSDLSAHCIRMSYTSKMSAGLHSLGGAASRGATGSGKLTAHLGLRRENF